MPESETSTPSSSPSRPRDAEGTRDAILAAAGELFSQKGFDGAGTREIAKLAGVDARLITRYFGSKENLFADVIDRAYQKPLLMTSAQNRAIAVSLLAEPAPALDGLALTLRSASNERAAEIMRRHIEEHYQANLGEALSGPDPVERAALLIAICAGVQLMRNVLAVSVLQDIDSDRIAGYLEAALNSIASGRSAVAQTEMDSGASAVTDEPFGCVTR